ncbi:MAG: hypothetical protein KC449_10190 [Anaerolineales bacterium]|nr:hypothetical protein [Anaerolineales bacterium]
MTFAYPRLLHLLPTGRSQFSAASPRNIRRKDKFTAVSANATSIRQPVA